ncbi:MAG: LUD domain-containing protein [Geobacteraceae bacterium]|nr:LUD domain-containing protein [Geobacteraceae bacterium]
MIARFQASAEAVGCIVKKFSTLSDAAAYVIETAGPVAAGSGLPCRIRQELAGLAFASPGQYRDTPTGVSFALAGIASTGSLLLDLADPVERSATALPPVHMVFLRASSIVPDIRDLHGALEKLISDKPHSYLSISTGPSRTADIERVLTIGVHGPRELQILIIEGD